MLAAGFSIVPPPGSLAGITLHHGRAIGQRRTARIRVQVLRARVAYRPVIGACAKVTKFGSNADG